MSPPCLEAVGNGRIRGSSLWIWPSPPSSPSPEVCSLPPLPCTAGAGSARALGGDKRSLAARGPRTPTWAAPAPRAGPAPRLASSSPGRPTGPRVSKEFGGEDSFDYIGLSSSWTRSSSKRDLRYFGTSMMSM